MAHLETIGEISCRNLELEWKVKDFFSLLEETDTFYKSPIFKFSYRSWFLACYPNGQTKHNTVGWTGIYLMLEDSAPQMVLQVLLSVQKATGELVLLWNGISAFHKRNTGWGTEKAIVKSELEDRKEELVPGNVLTIVVTMKKILQDDMKRDVQRRLAENVCLSLKSILTSGKYADVIFKLGDREFPAHRLILESRSAVFAAMFNLEMQEKKTGIVRIHGMDPDIFELVLSYVYSGEVSNITTDKVCEVFEAADQYDLKDLKKWCIFFMRDHLSLDNVCNVLAVADLYELKALKEAAVEFFSRNSQNILSSDKWKDFASQNQSAAVYFLTFIFEQNGANNFDDSLLQ